MTLEKLNYLTVLAEEQNVTRAAQRLFITQPTLTSFVNKLEKQLGFRLFDRTKNPVTLTDSGRKYIEQMRCLLTAELQLVEEIRKSERSQKNLRIGIGHIRSQLWIPYLLDAFLKKHPDVNIQIQESQEGRLLQMLHDNELDLVLGHLETDTVNFLFESVYEESMCLAIPENLFPKSGCTSAGSAEDSSPENPIVIQPELLNSLPLIQPSKTQGLFLNLKQLLNKYQIHPPKTIQTSNMITAARMVQLGLGYMYIAPSLLTYLPVQNPHKIYYCTLPHLAASRKIYLGCKRDNPNMNMIQDFREIIKTLK